MSLNDGATVYDTDVLDTSGTAESGSEVTDRNRVMGNSLALLAMQAKMGVALDGDKADLATRLLVNMDSYGLLKESCNQFVYATLATVSAALATNIPFDDTIPQVGEGDEIFSQSFTPKSATSIIEIDALIHISAAGAEHIIGAIFKDGAADAVYANAEYVGVADKIIPFRLFHREIATSITARTYSVRVGTASQNVVVNGIVTGPARRLGGVLVSSLTIREMQN